MKKLFVFLCVMLFIFGIVTAASAIPVQVTYTADNIVGAWYQDGASPLGLSLGSNYDNWSLADTQTLDLLQGTQYQIVWQVRNLEYPADASHPAGFLGQIDLGSSLILSSSSWQVSHTPVIPNSNFDDSGWNWHSATEYGGNLGDPNIWTDISGISGGAMWLWDGANYGNASTPFYQEIFVKATFKTAPVPEPGTILLLGSGLVGLVGIGRKKFFKK